MKKRISVLLSEEACDLVEKITAGSNQDFEAGTIKYSDVIEEMILHSDIDLKKLQIKHTDIRKQLRSIASKENVDIDSVIKSLMELKARNSKAQSQLKKEGALS